MSEASDFINCGACGDKRRYDEPHDCWVIAKVQTQETILEICPVCDEPMAAPHWRCEDRELGGEPVPDQTPQGLYWG